MRLMMKQGCIISLMHFYFHSKSSKKVFSHNFPYSWVSEYVMWYNNANNFIFSYRFQALTNYSDILIFFCTLNHIYLLIWLEANNLLWTYKKKLNMCDLNFLIIFILFLNWSIFLTIMMMNISWTSCIGCCFLMEHNWTADFVVKSLIQTSFFYRWWWWRLRGNENTNHCIFLSQLMMMMLCNNMTL